MCLRLTIFRKVPRRGDGTWEASVVQRQARPVRKGMHTRPERRVGEELMPVVGLVTVARTMGARVAVVVRCA
jgi:hypothetical protein